MISYSSNERPFADVLRDRLAGRGCLPKLDHLDIAVGERWLQTIGWWLSACHTAVVLLSESALKSMWVTYELSVLAHRANVRGDLHLVLVFLGVSRDEVCAEERFQPMELGALQSIEVPGGDEAADDALDRIEDVVLALVDDHHGSPMDPLVDLVHDVVSPSGDARLERAWRALLTESQITRDDPWLPNPGMPGRDPVALEYARTYCATSLPAAYSALDVLARGPHLGADDLVELVDLNVMTNIDPKLTHHLLTAAQGRGSGNARRSVVVGISHADLAELATRTVHEIGGAHTVYAFVLNGTISGGTVRAMAEGLAQELRDEIESVRDESADTFLAAVGEYDHPVYALLTQAEGITAPVLAALEQLFPTVVFVVLASAARPLPELTRALAVAGAGPRLDGEGWADHVEREQELMTSRVKTRQSLLRVKR